MIVSRRSSQTLCSQSGRPPGVRRKAILLCLALAALPCPIHALDFAFRLMPDISLPVLDSADYYTLGGGAMVSADLELLGFLAPFVEAGFHAVPTKNTGKSLSLTAGGAGVGFFYYPIPRLKLRVAAGAGPYYGTYGTLQVSNYYWKARAEAGYRFSPGFTLSAGADFSQYLYRPGILHSGISLGITLDINTALFAARESGLSIEASQSEPIYPLFYTAYERKPFGKAKITNTEQAEIRNVELSFLAGRYSSVPRVCASFPVIPRGETVEAPLYATLNEQVLSLTENTKVQGELIVSYSLLDTPMELRKAQTVRFNHRNATTWEDDRMAAAFVSPNDPSVLEHTKYVAGLIRDRVRSEIDSNLQYGMGFFEGLRLSGITCAPDLNTPYRRYHTQKKETDYLQFPHQTLAYKGGDCDDLAILYAAALESVGIPTAFIPLEDDVCVAFPLRMTESDARAAFMDPSALVYRNGTPWLPVQVSLMREGFMAAWIGGARKWNEAVSLAGTPPFISVQEAWKTFQPVGVSRVESGAVKPSEEQVGVAFENAINRFITREIGPRIQKLLLEMDQGGTARQHNSLGILYARYGMLAEAKAEFEKAAAGNYLPALNNLGNVSFLLRDFQGAVLCFEQVLSVQPENKAAIIGLARAKYELDQFTESDALFQKVQKIDPTLADRFSYLSSRLEGSAARGAAAEVRGGALWIDEEQ